MKKLKTKLINWLLSYLLNGYDINSVIKDKKTVNGDRYLILGNEIIHKEELEILKIEAQQIIESRSWHIIQNTLKDKAYYQMFVKSTSWEDMVAGKMILYCLDIQSKIIDILRIK